MKTLIRRKENIIIYYNLCCCIYVCITYMYKLNSYHINTKHIIGNKPKATKSHKKFYVNYVNILYRQSNI